jgi:hypothetical protein
MADEPPPIPVAATADTPKTAVVSPAVGHAPDAAPPPSERGWGPAFTGTYSQLLLAGVIFGSVYLKMDNLLLVLAGYVASNAQTVVGYYFGSSRGSQSKDDTIAKQLPK